MKRERARAYANSRQVQFPFRSILVVDGVWSGVSLRALLRDGQRMYVADLGYGGDGLCSGGRRVTAERRKCT
jgi:hypothetical protein